MSKLTSEIKVLLYCFLKTLRIQNEQILILISFIDIFNSMNWRMFHIRTLKNNFFGLLCMVDRHLSMNSYADIKREISCQF